MDETPTSQMTPQQMMLLSTLMNSQNSSGQKPSGGTQFATAPTAGSDATGALTKALQGAMMGKMLSNQQSQQAANGVTNYMNSGGEGQNVQSAGQAIGNSVAPLQFDEDGNLMGSSVDADMAAGV
jgi:hypothetical protein